MTTILIILAAIVVVGVCLETANKRGGDEFGEWLENGSNQTETYWTHWEDPLDTYSGSENLSRAEDLVMTTEN